MKKLSCLMLISVPFLAFSSISFGNDGSTSGPAFIKVQSTTPVYVKSDNVQDSASATTNNNESSSQSVAETGSTPASNAAMNRLASEIQQSP